MFDSNKKNNFLCQMITTYFLILSLLLKSSLDNNGIYCSDMMSSNWNFLRLAEPKWSISSWNQADKIC